MRGQMFDAQRTGYDPQRGMGYEAQRGPAYDPSRAAAGYDAQSRGVAGPQGQVPPMNIMQYGSTTPPTRNLGGGGYDADRGVNPARRWDWVLKCHANHIYGHSSQIGSECVDLSV